MPTSRKALPSRLYAIVDATAAAHAGWPVVDLACAYLDSGVRLLQLRAKDASTRDVLHWTDALAARVHATPGALLVTNDRVDVALAAGVPNVHVGQDDLAPADVRALVGPDGLVGLSTHTPAQIAAACAAPIDYLAVGPVFGTATKATGYDPVGLALVSHAAEAAARAATQTAAQPATPGATPRPVVAIGGISAARCAEVVAAGASAVAVIGGLLEGGDPAAAVRRYLVALGER